LLSHLINGWFPKDRSFIDAIVGSSGRESSHSLDAGWIISLAIVTSIPKNNLQRNDLRVIQSINSLRAYRAYEIKIDRFHLNSEPEEHLRIMFLGGKVAIQPRALRIIFLIWILIYPYHH
jgi:hypothetical protein